MSAMMQSSISIHYRPASLLLLAAISLGAFVAITQAGGNKQLGGILNSLFSTQTPIKLVFEDFSRLLRRAVKLSPEEDDSELTKNLWSLAKELQTLSIRDETKCYDYKQRAVLEQLKRHELIRPRKRDGTASNLDLHDPEEIVLFSNAYSFILKFQEMQAAFCGELLNSKASEEIKSFDPTRKEMALKFQEELRRRNILNVPTSNLEPIAGAIWALIKTFRPNLMQSKRKSNTSSSDTSDQKFDEAFDEILVGTCTSVREKLAQSTRLYRIGKVPAYNQSVRDWLDTEQHCVQILATVLLYKDSAYKAASKERPTAWNCFCAN